MNGIEPPSPIIAIGLPHAACEASSSAASSQAPSPAHSSPCPAHRLRERHARAVRRIASQGSSSAASTAFSASTVGGTRIESLASVNGRNTLPALPGAGAPPRPVTESAGRQVRLSTNWSRSSLAGLHAFDERKLGVHLVAQRFGGDLRLL